MWQVLDRDGGNVLECVKGGKNVFITGGAGTGKSFLLETLYLWCHIHGGEVSACAPTGIAATRIRIQRTPVWAFTLQYLCGLTVALESTFDPSKTED